MVEVRPLLILMKLWGRSQPTRFPRSSIRSVGVVTAHTFAERQIVRQRQARGEPALFIRTDAGT